MPGPVAYYSVAGLLVRTRPADLPAVAARLRALAGVDVHHEEGATGRLVVTLETEDLGDEPGGLERIRREAGVISAELVYHYVAPPGGPNESGAAHLPGGS